MIVSTKNAKKESLAIVQLDGPVDRRCGADADPVWEEATDKPIADRMRAVRFHPPENHQGARVSNYVSFAELPPADYEMRPKRQAIWWAVPSVIADPDYPYRRHLKK